MTRTAIVMLLPLAAVRRARRPGRRGIDALSRSSDTKGPAVTLAGNPTGQRAATLAGNRKPRVITTRRWSKWWMLAVAPAALLARIRYFGDLQSLVTGS